MALRRRIGRLPLCAGPPPVRAGTRAMEKPALSLSLLFSCLCSFSDRVGVTRWLLVWMFGALP
eukprot:4962546-Heterocapsa_arctica.AAC.1